MPAWQAGDKLPYRGSMQRFLTFASDAEILALWGAGFVVVALFTLVMERRRAGRTRIDGVGWMPWTGLFLTFAVIGGGLLAVAIPGMLRG